MFQAAAGKGFGSRGQGKVSRGCSIHETRNPKGSRGCSSRATRCSKGSRGCSIHETRCSIHETLWSFWSLGRGGRDGASWRVRWRVIGVVPGFAVPIRVQPNPSHRPRLALKPTSVRSACIAALPTCHRSRSQSRSTLVARLQRQSPERRTNRRRPGGPVPRRVRRGGDAPRSLRRVPEARPRRGPGLGGSRAMLLHGRW